MKWQRGRGMRGGRIEMTFLLLFFSFYLHPPAKLTNSCRKMKQALNVLSTDLCDGDLLLAGDG
jgi:hypothetical protein